MLEKRRKLLLLVMVSVFVLATGVLYAWVSAVSSGPTATHSGGSPSFCSGSAVHSFSYGNCNRVAWSYYASLYHNWVWIDADSDTGTHSGGGTFNKVSLMSGSGAAVYSSHNAQSTYDSAITDPDSGAHMEDFKETYLPRNTD